MASRPAQTLILSRQTPQTLTFVYAAPQLTQWIALFGVLLSLAFWFLGDQIRAIGTLFYWLGLALTLLLLLAAMASVTARKELRIDRETETVSFRERRLLIRSTSWSKAFPAFPKLALFRRAAPDNTPTERFRLVLFSRNGDEFRLGLDPLGIDGREAARELAQLVVDYMGVPLDEDPAVERGY